MSEFQPAVAARQIWWCSRTRIAGRSHLRLMSTLVRRQRLNHGSAVPKEASVGGLQILPG
jgi:hypothetical protein